MTAFRYIHRDLEGAVLTGTLRNRAEVIFGPRQVGKTTMLEHLVRDRQCIKLTGEDEDDLRILADPKSYL